MKLLKPYWVSEVGRAILCIDIHPSGTCFATGGQNTDKTGVIHVWNMAPVTDRRVEEDPRGTRLLSCLDQHLGCVNCLRWSRHSDQRPLLASGSDDMLVMLWTATSDGRRYKYMATLSGHTADVIDLAWAPHDLYLATCSVDNLVIIWSTSRWGDVVARLSGHKSLVKGVCWDPAGEYICSQSDDKTLRVWRVAGWCEEVTVQKPFADTAGTTAVLRCSWSPDGRYIVSAHGMNNGAPIASIIERSTWLSGMDFVGHKKAVTCSRFCDKLFRSAGTKTSSNNTDVYCACAIGSRDCSVSIWLTCLKRPLVVIYDLFDDSITDLSWNATHQYLMASSNDGSVAFMSFDQSELGRALTAAETVDVHHTLYGAHSVLTDSAFMSRHCASSGDRLVESAAVLRVLPVVSDMLRAHTVTQHAPPARAGGRVHTTSGCTQSADRRERKQIEQITADGRRRITSFITLSPPPDRNENDVNASPDLFQDSTEVGESNCSVSTSLVVTDTSDIFTDKSGVGVKSTDQSGVCVTSTDQSGVFVTSADQSGICVKSTDQSNVCIKSTDQSSLSAKLVSEVSSQLKCRSSSQMVRPSSSVQRHPSSKPRGRPSLSRRLMAECHLVSASSTTPTVSAHTSTPTSAGHVPQSADVTSSSSRQPTVRGEFQLCCDECRVHVDNTGCVSAALVTCSADNKTLWRRTFSNKRVHIARHTVTECGLSVLLLVGTDCCVHALHLRSGALLAQPLHVGEGRAIVRLVTRHSYIMAVSDTMHAHVFVARCHGDALADASAQAPAECMLDARRCDHTASSCRKGRLITHARANIGVVGGAIRLVGCSISGRGEPVVVTSSARAYIYLRDIQSWILLLDAKNQAYSLARFHTCVQSNSERPLSTIISQLNRLVPDSALWTSRNTSQLSPLIMCEFIEMLMNAAEILHSADEYKIWLVCYVRHLSECGDQAKLRALFESLLGNSQSDERRHVLRALGVDTDAMLRELLPLLLTNMCLQRLYTELEELVECSHALPCLTP